MILGEPRSRVLDIQRTMSVLLGCRRPLLCWIEGQPLQQGIDGSILWSRRLEELKVGDDIHMIRREGDWLLIGIDQYVNVEYVERLGGRTHPK